MYDKSGIVKMNINLISAEMARLSDMKTEYRTQRAMTILKLKPTNDVEYKIAELQADVEHKELYNSILKKEAEIETYKSLLNHKEEVLEEYEKFKKENGDLLELLDKLF